MVLCMSPDAVAFKKEVDLYKEKNKYLEEEIHRLRHNLKLLQKHRYGARSEKFIDTSEQLIFNDVEAEAKAHPQQEEFDIIPGYKRRKGRGKRKPLPENIPREEVIVDLSEAEKRCPKDDTELKLIGYDEVEKLICIPAKMRVLIEKRAKYACPCCEEHMAQAKALSILPKTIATPELLSFIVYSKFYQGLPLYRIEEHFKHQKVDLHRGTMAHWLIRASEQLVPIYNLLEEKAMATGYMAIDTTKVQVLKEPGRRAQSKSAMWVRGSPEKGIVLFEYDPSEGGKVAKRLMLGFEGALQADAHPGYGQVEHLQLLGCMMHSRRRFHKAWEYVGKKAGLAKDALRKFKKLYKLEEAYRDQCLKPEQRYEARLREVKPLMEKMLSWMQLQKQKIPPSGPLAEAFNYFVNHFDELSEFLKDGRFEVDNGWVERAIRKFAIGRNNWLFSTSVDGAKASAILYSLAVTAKLNGKDPFEALAELFREIPKAETIDDYERLTNLLLK